MNQSVKLSVWRMIRCCLLMACWQGLCRIRPSTARLFFTHRWPGRRQTAADNVLPNLLPWRRQRQWARGRFWLTLLTASSLLLCTLATALHYGMQQYIRQLRLTSQQQQALNQGLQQRLNAAKRHYQQQQRLQQASVIRQQRQQIIRRWRVLLQHIASELPANAWITALHYQQSPSQTDQSQPPQLRIDGFAMDVNALQGSASTFNHLPGFGLARPGTTELDGDNWRFCFLLAEERP